jgi:predicted DCC family thiol-disulfide oxidoreductase YuxK
MTNRPILFYDSDCGFCNGVVQFVIRHERAPVLTFAPIGGTTAAQVGVPPELGKKTLVLVEGDRRWIRSRAVWRIMHHMGGGWRSAAEAVKFIPAPLADAGYRVVASVRRHLPGKTNCGILPTEQRGRFLE